MQRSGKGEKVSAITVNLQIPDAYQLFSLHVFSIQFHVIDILDASEGGGDMSDQGKTS